MPLTIASVFNFVPINVWKSIKKFVTKDRTVVLDLPFKMSTKYTSGLLIVLMCLSFANEFVRNVEISCSTNGFGGKGKTNGYTTNNDDEKELNDFCWNYETFLVVKALQPNMRGMVTYPGVSGYNRGTDELLRQRYYKFVWLILGKLTVITFLPYFFWKARATKKIEPLVNVDSEEFEDEERMSNFLETIGFNGGFAWYYMACKVLATLSPLCQWYYLCGFLGQRYKFYGLEVFRNFIDESAPWPDPMDALFPKMAKCEWNRYGFGGDIEIRSAHCQLPMNNITQWSFFVYWFWIAVVFVVNILSLVYLFVHIFPCCRRYKYRKFVGLTCREDVEKLINFAPPQVYGKKMSKQQGRSKIIQIKMGFGDWLVLSFIKKNLEEWKFRDFIRRLATSETNVVIQLKPIPIPLPMSAPSFSTLSGKDIQSFPDEQSIGQEIGFKANIIQGCITNPPSYHSYETGSTDADDSPLPLSLVQDSVTSPVKIDRNRLSRQSKQFKQDKQDKQQKKTAPAPPTKTNSKKNVEYGWKPAVAPPKKKPSNNEKYRDNDSWD